MSDWYGDLTSINEDAAVDRLAEFARQARLNRDVEPTAVYTVWTDPLAARVSLSLDDIDLVVDAMRSLSKGERA